jgi:CHAT domain
MKEFGLQVTVFASGVIHTEKLGQGGDVERGNVDSDRLRSRTLECLSGLLNSGRLQTREELEVLGEHLFETLFVPQVSKPFWEMLDAKSRGQYLMVRLSFEESPEDLAALPWEYLYAPDTQTRPGFFLSAKVDLVLSRYLPLERGEPPALEPGPLRVLVLVSEPSNLAMKQLTRAAKSADRSPLEELESAIRESGHVELETSTEASRMGFINPVSSFRPHVLHVIGHGHSHRRDPARIALLERDGTADWVPESIFADAFDASDWRPPVVVLHLWEPKSADGDATLSFERLGPALVRKRIPAVVAMRNPMGGGGTEFSRWFYGDLARGESVDAAVRQARYMLSMKSAPWEFGTPVLYLHNVGGLIQREDAPTLEAAPGARSPRDARGDDKDRVDSNGAGAQERTLGSAPRAKPAGSEERDLAALEDLASAMIGAGRERLDELQPDAETRLLVVKRLLKLKQDLAGLAPGRHSEHLMQVDASGDPVWGQVLSAVVEAALIHDRREP